MAMELDLDSQRERESCNLKEDIRMDSITHIRTEKLFRLPSFDNCIRRKQEKSCHEQ
jgi:hypothetical protein